MAGKNCWEYKNCGRQPGGDKNNELGVCPASTDKSINAINSGKNGGRICWAIAGTFCGGEVQGAYAQKKISCMSCDFFKKVKEEEASGFQLLKPGQIYKVPE